MYNKTIYTAPAKMWYEAQPLGNGSIGAMVFGGVEREEITLNHDTLWSGIPKIHKVKNASETYLRIKELVLSDDYVGAYELASKKFLGAPTETYLPFGNMVLSFKTKNATAYKKVLDLSKSCLDIDYKSDGINYHRKYFISYPDNAFVIKLTSDKSGCISFDAELNSPLKNAVLTENSCIILDGECPWTSNAETSFKQKYEYSEKPEEKGIGFRGILKIVAENGVVSAKNGKLTVADADSAIIVFTICTSFNGFDKHPYLEGAEYKEKAVKTVSSAINKGYEKLFASHIEDYCPLYNKIVLDLGKSGREDMPTPERLMQFNKDYNDISLYTLLFNFGRYLTIASSRAGSQATNLQGIWNKSTTPDWRCNYTVNINTEMNYWPTLMCGLESCYEPLISFVEGCAVTGSETARNFYNAGGFVIHHNSDIWRYTTPAPFDAKWGFWNGASGWFCRNLYDYYEYTRDTEYLKNRCLPIMKKAAEFYLDILCDRGDGKLSVCPATSPENRFVFNGECCGVAKYTAMTDAIVYDLFKNYIEACEILGESDSEFLSRVTQAYKNMNPFTIGSDGRLLEWNAEFEEEDYNHRHASHLFGLHPGRLISPETTPELAEACRKTLKRRGDGGTGWSLGWKINFAARLNDGNHALKFLKTQLKYIDTDECDYKTGGTYANLFDAHPPFQIDGNFGAVSGMLEMLADIRDGELKLLPALPDEWKNGKIRGLHLRNGKTVDFEWKDGKVIKTHFN